MPALNYGKQFAPKILEGKKIHTIRRMRKRPVRPGDNLFHFTGQRTKECIRLLENKCIYAKDISIVYFPNRMLEAVEIKIGEREIKDIQKLAKNDGFDCFQDFINFFIASGLPFYGQLVGWTEYPGYGE